MKRWTLALAVPLWLVATAGTPRPAPDVLRHPGETTVFAFVTRSGKAVSLCQGPKAAYLVYRFGTAARVELQYPALLDASSWRKFTYFRYMRGGGVANAGEEINQLSFKNGGAEYVLLDETHAELNKAKEEVYPRGVSVAVTVSGKEVAIDGNADTARGNLYLSDEQRGRVKLADE